jgi:hypothetical protein
MEPNYSVILFSKYSRNSQNIFEMLNNSNINPVQYNLQFLCIDNEKVRYRIKNNKKLDIHSVPCLLTIFSNGTVEKYEGQQCMDWIENFITTYGKPVETPRQEISVQYSDPPVQTTIVTEQKQVRENPPQYRQNITSDETEQETSEQRVKQSVRIPKNMRPINQNKNSITSINDLPLEEDSSNERHRNPPKTRRVRQDVDKFIEDDVFFREDEQQETPSPVKKSGVNAIKAKAEELARGRDDMEKQFSNKNRLLKQEN